MSNKNLMRCSANGSINNKLPTTTIFEGILLKFDQGDYKTLYRIVLVTINVL